jgi:hypothetical protein
VARLEGRGFDGSTYVPAAMMVPVVDGSVSTGIVPTRWEFRAMNAAGSLTPAFDVHANGSAQFPEPVHFANLGTPVNGTFLYCDDCTNAVTPCTGAGTGAIAKRLSGAWDCR